jgi:hypothetical protein
VEKIAQNVAKQLFVKMDALLLLCGKVTIKNLYDK